MEATWRNLADGAAQFTVDHAGAPDQILTLIDLDAQGAPDPQLTFVPGPDGVVVGITEKDPHPAALPHLTCWVTPDEVGSVVETVQCSPVASVTLAQLLRVGSRSVRSALVAESMAYSMLLAGDEFATWLSAREQAPVDETPQPCVDVAREGTVLTILLARPDRHNAYSASMRDGLRAALDVAIADSDLQVVLRGAGPSFCSGGDLVEFGLARDVASAHLLRLHAGAALSLYRLRDRTTTQVHGACIGAGIELAAFTGRVEASADAWFQLPELGMGLVPGAGGTVSLPRRIGRWRTASLALTRRRVDAGTALSWGLVDACAP